MRYTAEHSEETRQRVLDAAGRQFRLHGFGGIGIDGLTKAAGVTSGAFYGHFRTKADAFRAVAVQGLERLLSGLERFRTQNSSGWLDAFARFYLSSEHRKDVGGGCALPSLTAEVGRAAPAARAEFEAELLRIADAVIAGLPAGDQSNREAAWPILALLAGGTMLARAVKDEVTAEQISEAVLAAVRREAGIETLDVRC